MKDPSYIWSRKEKLLWEQGYRPAYLDRRDENLDENSYCRFCKMIYYNCLCSHDDDD